MRMIVLLLSGVCILFSGRAHAMNGGDWYQECSQWLYTSSDGRQKQPTEKILAQRACRIDAIRIYCDANYEGDARGVWKEASDDKTPIEQALKKFCPRAVTAWNFPLGGPTVLVLSEVEKEGGPGMIERLTLLIVGS